MDCWSVIAGSWRGISGPIPFFRQCWIYKIRGLLVQLDVQTKPVWAMFDWGLVTNTRFQTVKSSSRIHRSMNSATGNRFVFFIMIINTERGREYVQMEGHWWCILYNTVHLMTFLKSSPSIGHWRSLPMTEEIIIIKNHQENKPLKKP